MFTAPPNIRLGSDSVGWSNVHLLCLSYNVVWTDQSCLHQHEQEGELFSAVQWLTLHHIQIGSQFHCSSGVRSCLLGLMRMCAPVSAMTIAPSHRGPPPSPRTHTHTHSYFPPKHTASQHTQS